MSDYGRYRRLMHRGAELYPAIAAELNPSRTTHSKRQCHFTLREFYIALALLEQELRTDRIATLEERVEFWTSGAAALEAERDEARACAAKYYGWLCESKWAQDEASKARVERNIARAWAIKYHRELRDLKAALDRAGVEWEGGEYVSLPVTRSW